MNYLLRNCRKAFFVFALSLFVVNGVVCQNIFVGGDMRYGHILCNDDQSRAHINSSTYGFSFYIGNNFAENEYWHSYWNFPSFGLELSYDYIDNAVTGNKLGALFFIRPSFYKTERLSLNPSSFPHLPSPTPADTMVPVNLLLKITVFSWQSHCRRTDIFVIKVPMPPIQ